MKDGRGNKPKYFVKDGDDDTITILKAAKKLGMSAVVIRDYVRRCGCVTIQDIEERREKLKEGPGDSGRNTHSTTKGDLSIAQIYDMHPFKDTVSLPIISGRISRRGSMCPSLWYPKCRPLEFRKMLIKDGLEVEIDQSRDRLPKLKFKLDRGRCAKDGGCHHYRECTNNILFDNKMPERHKSDYSCHTRDTQIRRNHCSSGCDSGEFYSSTSSHRRY